MQRKKRQIEGKIILITIKVMKMMMSLYLYHFKKLLIEYFYTTKRKRDVSILSQKMLVCLFFLLNFMQGIHDIKNVDSHAMFCKKLSTFIKPLENDTCYVHALLKRKIQNITFYAAKITNHFAQPL